MTREEILAMQPGPILEYYVALNVMGFSPSELRDGWIEIGKLATYPKRYSTDISASWEVVEKIGGMEEWMLYRVSHSDTVDEVDLGYACEFLNVKRGYSVTCEAITAPEAICKAALLAVMEVTA